MGVDRRRRNLLENRRRVDDEGEDEEGVDDVGDSQSEASVLTEDQAEVVGVNGSDAGDGGEQLQGQSAVNDKDSEPLETFPGTADTQAMVNGFKAGPVEQGESFEDAVDNRPTQAKPVPSTRQGFREQEKFKSRRGHDVDLLSMPPPPRARPQLDGAPGSYVNGLRSARRNGPGARPNHTYVPTTMAKWDHDLHESVLAPPEPSKPQERNPTSNPRNLSKSIAVGNVAARIWLPLMSAPKVLDKKILVRQHTKLPDLRPPLRRDKAVRVSIPGHEPRYLFPSMERSFIFIPRAQRPNQQNKNRNKGPWSRGGSRRTSVYGGSGYSPSIAMSRRSSIAMDGVHSPLGLYGRGMQGSKPVVRLPQYMAGHDVSEQYPPVFGPSSQDGSYPLPSEPARREHRSSQMTMHQPRPQKQMSVASIEIEQQPFHQQLPFTPQNDSNVDPRFAQATPLQNIPEGAINAQPFQPVGMPAQYYGYPMQPVYYYPESANYNMASPMYMQQPYYMPMMMPVGAEDSGQASMNMYMQESNGMVYYYDPSQLMTADGSNGVGSPAQGGYGAQANGITYYAGH